MITWLVVIAVGAGSFALRAVPILGSADWMRSRRVEQLMAHAGTAAIAAISVSAVEHAATGVDGAIAPGAASAVALVMSVRGAPMWRVLLGGATAYGVLLALLSLAG